LRKRLAKGGESLCGAPDDRDHEREPVARGANDRLGAAADADPGRYRPGLGAGIGREPVDRGALRSAPGHRLLLEQLGEEVDLLLEEILVVAQVVAEQRERLDAGPAPEDDLGATVRDRIERRVALEDPYRVVGADDGDGRPEMDPRRARRDRREHHVARGHGEVVGVMLADAEVVEAHLVGQVSLVDEVANRLCVRQRPTVVAIGDIAERVQAERDVVGSRSGVHGALDCPGLKTDSLASDGLARRLVGRTGLRSGQRVTESRSGRDAELGKDAIEVRAHCPV